MKIKIKLLIGNLVQFLIVLISGIVFYYYMKNTVRDHILLELEGITNNSISIIETGITSSVKNHLYTIANKSKEIISYYYSEYENGKISEKVAYQNVKKIFLNPKYNKIGTSGYLAGVSNKGVLVIHPKAEGLDVSMHDFMKTAISMKSGYLEYYWRNPNEEKERLKVGALEYFEPWNLIVWASSYKNEFNTLIKPEDFEEGLLSIQIKKSGYVYVLDTNGIVIIHPYLKGKDVSGIKDSDGYYFVKEILDKKNGQISYNWIDQNETKPRKKTAYFKYIAEMNWILVTSVYDDEVYADLNTLTFMISIIALISSGLIFFASIKMSSFISNPIQKLISSVNEIKKGNLDVLTEVNTNDEIGELSNNFNEMVIQIKMNNFELIKLNKTISGLLKNLNVGVYRNTAGEYGKFIQANPAIAKMFGYDTVEDFLKIQVSNMYVDPNERINFVNMLKENGECRNYELSLKTKEGKFFWGSLSAKVKYDEDRNVEWIDGILEDVTEIKKARDELEKLNIGLEQKVQERTVQIENQSKELKSLYNFTYLINSHSNLSDILVEILKYVYERYGINEIWLFLPDEKTECLKSFKAYSYKNPQDVYENLYNFEVPINENGGISYFVWKRQKPFYIKRVKRFQFEIDKEMYQKARSKSMLYVPLLNKNKSIGMIILTNLDKLMLLTKSDIRSINTFCSQIAGVIHTANLLKESEDAKKSIEIERQKSEKLLLNILPFSVASELKESGEVKPVYYEDVSIMFTDFKGFTQIAETLSPQELVKELDGCFTQFDKIVERFNLEKLKTIGDSYMCAGGLPIKNNTHAIDCCLAALEIQSFMNQMKEIKEMLGLPYWELRLGIHSGQVMAGVVGEKKFAYDIWGDTVNTASRMESSGTPGRINISYSTYEKVKDYFDCEYRGEVDAKNKGKVKMYYLNQIKEEYLSDKKRQFAAAKIY